MLSLTRSFHKLVQLLQFLTVELKWASNAHYLADMQLNLINNVFSHLINQNLNRVNSWFPQLAVTKETQLVAIWSSLLCQGQVLPY